MAEANQERGEIAVSLGDSDLVLVPSFQRTAKAEAMLGRPLVQLAGELAGGQGLTVTEQVGLITIFAQDPKPSEEELGALITRIGYAGVVPVLQKIVDRAVFGVEDKEGNAPEGGSSDG